MMQDRRELLISRAVDRAATPEDWAELEACADEDPALWRTLGRTLQAQALVDAVARPQIERAERVLAPRPQTHRAQSTWIGWAAALLLAIGWTLTGMNGAGENSSEGGHSIAGIHDLVLDAEEALQHYRDRGAAEGRILRELPRRVLHVVPAEDGRAIVEYVRQFHEREVVDGFYRIQQDDSGRPTPVRVSPTPVRKGRL